MESYIVGRDSTNGGRDRLPPERLWSRSRCAPTASAAPPPSRARGRSPGQKETILSRSPLRVGSGHPNGDQQESWGRRTAALVGSAAERTSRQVHTSRRRSKCPPSRSPRRASPIRRRTPWDRAEAQETERQLLIRYHREGDLAAREELAERFLPLARDLALRYTYTDEPFDDLLQVASLGLVKAIDRFDPERGTKFTSYAAPTILGELKRHFRDKGWALHVPRDLQERTLAVSRATEALSKRLGRSPKVREVAAELGCSRRARARGPGGRGQLRGRFARRADLPRGRRGRLPGRPDGRRGHLLRAGREPRRDRQHLEGAARRGASGAGAALHARPDAARDRRADRLLADARPAACCGARSTGWETAAAAA